MAARGRLFALSGPSGHLPLRGRAGDTMGAPTGTVGGAALGDGSFGNAAAQLLRTTKKYESTQEPSISMSF